MQRLDRRFKRYKPRLPVRSNAGPVSSVTGYDRELNPNEFSRVLTLSDGVFAIALTLLVLSLEVPSGLSRRQFRSELIELSPMVLSFAISVGVIALFWFSHHELFAQLQRVDHRLIGINIVFLSLVVLVPFAQRLQGTYPLEPLAYVIFAGLLATLNVVDTLMHREAHNRGLLTRAWSSGRYRTEMQRGIVLTSGFLVSIPLAFVFVQLAVVVWILMLPVDQLVARRGKLLTL
jgi:uncharacterized membrane protein